MPKGIFLISVTIYMFASLCLAVKIPYLSHFLTGSLDPILVICSVISLIIAAGNIYMLSHNLMHGIVIGLLLQISVLFGYFNNFYGNHLKSLISQHVLKMLSHVLGVQHLLFMFQAMITHIYL